MERGLRVGFVAVAALAVCGSAFAQSTECASIAPGGAPGSGDSGQPSISADGRFVAFHSDTANLVPGDTNSTIDVFVHDRVAGALECQTLAAVGPQVPAGGSFPDISGDGRYVVFGSWATNLIAADLNGSDDVFLRDRQTGVIECMSLTSNGGQANHHSGQPSVSDDGRFVAFVSRASNFFPGDSNDRIDAFVRDRQTTSTVCVSLDPGGWPVNADSQFPSISGDGRFVAFQRGDDVYVYDLQLGVLEVASVSTGGSAGFGASLSASISADGRYVAFTSNAEDLVPGDTNTFADIFVRDRLGSTTERVNWTASGGQGNGHSGHAAISRDGRYVTFLSFGSNFVPGDTNSSDDVFLRDRLLGSTERVSVATNGAQGNSSSQFNMPSDDGRFVAFHSYASNFAAGDANGHRDVFVRDRTGPPPAPFCAGDGSIGPCPCGNVGAAGRGCQNSASTGGAILTTSGSWSLSADTLVLTSSFELPSATTLFFQGTVATGGASFGDGLRCVGGTLVRLYQRNASGGVVSAPQAGDPSISARSAANGDAIAAGSSRHYQAWYRDPFLSFCPSPAGNSWNVSSALTVIWGP